MACTFGPVGWIAMVLVDAAFRRRGIGGRLVERALTCLDARGVRTARLDATPLGRPVYERLGFRARYGLARWEGIAAGGASRDAVLPLAAAPLEAVAALDQSATATDRLRLLRLLDGQEPGAMRVFRSAEQLSGYATFRRGGRATQIGPAVAMTEEAGLALLDSVLAACAGQRVYVDIPSDNAAAVRWAESKGLAIQRPFTRMDRGQPLCDDPARLWASSGPENG
jgi:hypothetical protein